MFDKAKQKLISMLLAFACILTVSGPAITEGYMASEPAVGVVASVIGGAITVDRIPIRD